MKYGKSPTGSGFGIHYSHFSENLERILITLYWNSPLFSEAKITFYYLGTWNNASLYRLVRQFLCFPVQTQVFYKPVEFQRKGLTKLNVHQKRQPSAVQKCHRSVHNNNAAVPGAACMELRVPRDLGRERLFHTGILQKHDKGAQVIIRQKKRQINQRQKHSFDRLYLLWRWDLQQCIHLVQGSATLLAQPHRELPGVLVQQQLDLVPHLCLG